MRLLGPHWILVVFFFALTEAQDPIGCYIEGECLGGLFLEENDQFDPASCHQQCIDTDGCEYFTHYSSDNTCFSYESCPEVSTDGCADCISGDVSCDLEESDSIGCYLQGECLGAGFLEVDDQPDPLSCHQQCIDTSGCLYFTHYAEDLTCFSYQSCPEFTADGCSDCISGDVSCPLTGTCVFDGQCLGIQVDFDGESTSAGACSDFCLATSGCGWWTYDSSNQNCVLTEDCEVDETCETCVSGQVGCDGGSSVTTTEVPNTTRDGTTQGGGGSTGSGDCAYTLTGSGEQFQSPGYPDAYPDNSYCTWAITGDGGTVTLNFLDVDMADIGQFCGAV